jgi:hypothetical protein
MQASFLAMLQAAVAVPGRISQDRGRHFRIIHGHADMAGKIG